MGVIPPLHCAPHLVYVSIVSLQLNGEEGWKRKEKMRGIEWDQDPIRTVVMLTITSLVLSKISLQISKPSTPPHLVLTEKQDEKIDGVNSQCHCSPPPLSLSLSHTPRGKREANSRQCSSCLTNCSSSSMDTAWQLHSVQRR